jgi:hypothetical protein
MCRAARFVPQIYKKSQFLACKREEITLLFQQLYLFVCVLLIKDFFDETSDDNFAGCPGYGTDNDHGRRQRLR